MVYNKDPLTFTIAYFLIYLQWFEVLNPSEKGGKKDPRNKCVNSSHSHFQKQIEKKLTTTKTSNVKTDVT